MAAHQKNERMSLLMKNRMDLGNVAVHVYSKYIGLRGVAMAFAVTFH